MASLVYASSRQSDGAPISYPPTTSEVTVGTAMTSQPLQRRRIPARRSGSGTVAGSAGGAATSRGCAAANATAGSGDPMSVSATVVPPGCRLQAGGALPLGYPGSQRDTAAVHVFVIRGGRRLNNPFTPGVPAF